MDDDPTLSLYLTQEHVELIGWIVAIWTTCEQTMFDDVMLARAIPTIDTAGIAWPIQVSTGRLITQWRPVADSLNAEFGITYNLDGLADRLRRMNFMRNLVAHGFFDLDPRSQKTTVSMISWDDDLGTFVQQPYFIDIPTLREIRRQTAAVSEELVNWTEIVQAAAQDRRATNPKVATPTWPEVLTPSPKRLQF